MAATLNFNGIRIMVPVEELAAAIRQLRLLTGNAESEAAIAARNLQADTPVALPPQFGPGSSDEETTLSFLKTIAAHEPLGTPITAIMGCLGAAHPKGVGSKMAMVNRVLDRAGFAIPDVYSNPRDAHGERLWRAGPRLISAITTVEAFCSLGTVDLVEAPELLGMLDGRG